MPTAALLDENALDEFGVSLALMHGGQKTSVHEGRAEQCTGFMIDCFKSYAEASEQDWVWNGNSTAAGH